MRKSILIQNTGTTLSLAHHKNTNIARQEFSKYSLRFDSSVQKLLLRYIIEFFKQSNQLLI